VAALASYPGMTICESKPAVIKSGIAPICRRMADAAFSAKVAVVFVVLLMAGITVGGRALENTVDMASLTSNFGMASFKVKGEQAVIYSCIVPIVRVVAGSAVCPKSSIMLIVISMT
jgi:hypothetical protein